MPRSSSDPRASQSANFTTIQIPRCRGVCQQRPKGRRKNKCRFCPRSGPRTDRQLPAFRYTPCAPCAHPLAARRLIRYRPAFIFERCGGPIMDAAHLYGRSLLTLSDFPPSDIRLLLALARRAKADRRAGTVRQRFAGMSLALLYEKPSTRTRCAFDTAFGEDGGHTVFLGADDIHLGAKESLEDTARILGRMFDAIQFRGFRQDTVEALARLSGAAGVQRLDRHPPSHSGARRPDDARRALRPPRRAQAGVRGRLPQQRGEFADDRLQPDRRALQRRRPGRTGASARPCAGSARRMPPPAAPASSAAPPRRWWPAPTPCTPTCGYRWGRSSSPPRGARCCLPTR